MTENGSPAGPTEEPGPDEPAASPSQPVPDGGDATPAEPDSHREGEREAAGPGEDRGRGDTGGDAAGDAENSPLRDDQAEDGAVAGPQGEEGQEEAHNVRLAGFQWLLGDGNLPAGTSNLLTGDGNRIFQADTMTVVQGVRPGRSYRGTWSTDDLSELRRSYAPGESHRALLSGFERHRVQVLLGRAGYGRTTTALAAVADWVAPSGGSLTDLVYIMDTDDLSTSMDGGVLPAGAGAVLVLAPGTRAPGVAWKNEVTGRLPPEAVLVVVADTPPAATSAHNTAYLVEYALPRLADVLAQHLRTLLDERVAARIQALQAVRDELKLCRRPREAARLAVELADGWHNGLEPEVLLKARHPTELLNDAEKELAEGTRWERAFLVSGAIFDGLAVGLVTREASRLAAVMPRTGAPDERDSVSAPPTPISDWSKCVRVGAPEAGTSLVARPAHPSLIPFVLEMLWQKHIPLRDPLLAWLKSTATHPDIRVRVKAAQAVAKLATYDFDVIRNEVLRPWADDGGARSRQTAAWALEALALIDDRRYAARVRVLVRGWSRENNVQRQAAGIVAYGTYLGSEYADEALACMRRAAGGRVRRPPGRRDGVEQTERVLAKIVEQSIVDVFVAGARETVVAELAEWTRMPVWRCRQCAGRCLVRLAGRRDPGSSWPILMELIKVEPELRMDVFALWRNALDENPGPTAKALHRLIGMAERADQEMSTSAVGQDPAPQTPEAVQFRALTYELLSELASGDTQADRERRRRLRFLIHLWEFRDQRQLTIIPSILRG
ncbi:hypothetical protein [Frankia sp. CiP3]|uniref:hypothetical protein n=1 Tax=Frankia sp. CiP3 TaxID=2880971 RepID=UPI001EF65C8A|nr:hypothetical protein [Frankia sp. CiP3]